MKTIMFIFFTVALFGQQLSEDCRKAISKMSSSDQKIREAWAKIAEVECGGGGSAPAALTSATPASGAIRLGGGSSSAPAASISTSASTTPAATAPQAKKKPVRASEVFKDLNETKPERIATETAKAANATVFSDQQIAVIGKFFNRVAGTQAYKRGTDTPVKDYKGSNLHVWSRSAGGYELQAFRAKGSPEFGITDRHLALATQNVEKPITGDLLFAAVDWLTAQLDGKNPPIPADLSSFISSSKEGRGVVENIKLPVKAVTFGKFGRRKR